MAGHRPPPTTCPTREGSREAEAEVVGSVKDPLAAPNTIHPFSRFMGRCSGRRRAPRLHWRGGGGGGEEDQKLPHRASQLPDQLPQLPNRTTQHSDDTSQTPDPSSLRTRPSSNLGSNPTLPMINLPRLPKLSGFSLPHLSHSQPWLAALVLVILLVPTDACSSRSTPKPRPPSPTMRPNITFQTYACPPAYAAWYCLNGATCFTVKIGISILYNCECADGFMGQRCEFKDLDGTYLSSSEKLRMAASQTVGSASSTVIVGVMIIVVGTIAAAAVFTSKRTRAKMRQIEQIRASGDDVDEEEESGDAESPPPVHRPRPLSPFHLPRASLPSSPSSSSSIQSPSKPPPTRHWRSATVPTFLPSNPPTSRHAAWWRPLEEDWWSRRRDPEEKGVMQSTISYSMSQRPGCPQEGHP